jgi:hypothetical protein
VNKFANLTGTKRRREEKKRKEKKRRQEGRIFFPSALSEIFPSTCMSTNGCSSILLVGHTQKRRKGNVPKSSHLSELGE